MMISAVQILGLLITTSRQVGKILQLSNRSWPVYSLSYLIRRALDYLHRQRILTNGL